MCRSQSARRTPLRREQEQSAGGALEQIEELIRDIPVKDLTSETARMYGEIRAELEKQGHPIGNNDLWIGAHAMATIWAGRPLPVRTKNPENPRAMIMIT